MPSRYEDLAVNQVVDRQALAPVAAGVDVRELDEDQLARRPAERERAPDKSMIGGEF